MPEELPSAAGEQDKKGARVNDDIRRSDAEDVLASIRRLVSKAQHSPEERKGAAGAPHIGAPAAGAPAASGPVPVEPQQAARVTHISEHWARRREREERGDEAQLPPAASQDAASQERHAQSLSQTPAEELAASAEPQKLSPLLLTQALRISPGKAHNSQAKNAQAKNPQANHPEAQPAHSAAMRAAQPLRVRINTIESLHNAPNPSKPKSPVTASHSEDDAPMPLHESLRARKETRERFEGEERHDGAEPLIDFDAGAESFEQILIEEIAKTLSGIENLLNPEERAEWEELAPPEMASELRAKSKAAQGKAHPSAQNAQAQDPRAKSKASEEGGFFSDAIDHADLPESRTALSDRELRALIGEIIREELQGALGERLTRNMRKLVRREMHRALLAHHMGETGTDYG